MDREYPHPEQWTIDMCPGRKPLDKIGVREITTALRKPRLEQPSCIKNWEARLEEAMPWPAIGENLAKGIGTNKDTSSWFKNILHRGLYLKSLGGQDEPCGACRGARDTWAHLWCCPTFEPLWSNMVELANTLLPHEGGKPQASYCAKFVFLGVLENGHTLPRSMALLHMLMWKFVIQDLMQKNQNEHYIIDASKTSTRALRRYMTRISAQLKSAQKRILRAKPRGPKVDLKGINKRLSPIAMLSESGEEIIWEDNMRRWPQATGAIDAENYPEDPPGLRPDDDIGGQ